MPGLYGLGSQLKVDPELVIPNKTLSILDGAICASGWNNVRGDGISRMYFDALSKSITSRCASRWKSSRRRSWT